MRTSKIAGRESLLLAGLIAAGLGGYAGWLEAGPYLGRGSSEVETIARIESGQLAPAMSQQSHQQVATDCLTAASSLYFRTRPTAQRQAFAARCQELLRASVTAMPSFSFGWYVLAALDPVNDDFDALNRDLSNSQASGGAEQWIAELRVALAEDYYDRLQGEAREAESQDLATLVLSQRGVDGIAKRYVDDPGFRERITAIVENLPPEAQARFVGYVRLAAGQS
ncbi:MAG TPA: hypothetical protein VG757_01655 [Devosia sp.]|nr:hypothetical protein [Devosia sp.]